MGTVGSFRTWSRRRRSVPVGAVVPALLVCGALGVCSPAQADDSALDDGSRDGGVTAEGTECVADPTPIGTVQGDGATSPLVGQKVTVQGVVVGDYEGRSPALRGFYLQGVPDGLRDTSDAIFVFHGDADTVGLSDSLQVTGTVSEYHGQTQISVGELRSCPVVATRPAKVTHTPETQQATRAAKAQYPQQTQQATHTPKAQYAEQAWKPVATALRLPVTGEADLERLEGMLVRLPQALRVTEHYQLARFGQITVTSGDRLRQPTALYRPQDPRRAALQAAQDLDQLIVDDATNAQNPDPIVQGRGGRALSASNTLRGGDVLSGAVGVLTYTWGGNAASPDAFRLRAQGALSGRAVVRAANPRPRSSSPAGPGEVRVASANVLNYFNTFGNKACRAGSQGEVVDCRGAKDEQEFTRQAAKTVAELTSLQADAIALLEMENDGYGPDSALQDLVDRLNTAQGQGTWASIDVDTATGVVDAAGNDAIRTAILYRPARLTPVSGGTWTHRTSEVFQRNPVAQAFRTRSGAVFSVVANHFKSKGSCPTQNPAEQDAQDGQGCWNATRVAQAQSLAGFVRDTVVPGAGDADVLLVGDLNSYAQEDPVVALREAGYTDLIRRYGGKRAYSYAYDGLWGYLDHALASASLRDQVTDAQEVHVNADEPSALDATTSYRSPVQLEGLYAPDRFRSSDHDPLIVGLRLTHAGSSLWRTVQTRTSATAF